MKPFPAAGATVAPGGSPIERVVPGSTYGVLLIHGFTGYPAEMTSVADTLEGAGHSVHALRLPGHGTTGSDFLRTGWRQWLSAVLERFMEIRARYRRAAVCGLSMGGVLAAIVAARLEADRVAMLAPAFLVNSPLVPLAPMLQHVVPRRRVNHPGTDDEDAVRRYFAEEYWSYQWPRQAASLYRIMRIGRRALGSVTCPAMTIVSDADLTVPARVGDYVNGRIGSTRHEVVRLAESGHVLTVGVDRATVADHVARLLSEPGFGA